jgi:LmbE family N-acetylglucosaminyl deacetylase
MAWMASTAAFPAHPDDEVLLIGARPEAEVA